MWGATWVATNSITSSVSISSEAGHDERLGELACLLVGDPEHGAVGDVGMGDQDCPKRQVVILGEIISGGLREDQDDSLAAG